MRTRAFAIGLFSAGAASLSYGVVAAAEALAAVGALALAVAFLIPMAPWSG